MSKDLESLGERIAEHAAHLDAAMHRLLSDLRQFDQGGGWGQQGARSCAAWLSWRVGWDMNTAREHVRVANRLAELPETDRALQKGEVSYSKVRAMTRIATPENESYVLELARLMTAQQLETACRQYRTVQRHGADVTPKDDLERRYVSRRDTADGMVCIQAMLHPDEAAVVWAALESHAKRACEARPVPAETRRPARAFDRADALVAIADAYVRGDRPDRSPVELVVTVDAQTLAAAAAPDATAVGSFRDGTCVSAETTRRLACDAGVVKVAVDGDGKTLSVGRKTRTLPARLKRALLKRDQTCRFPGCTNRVFLEGHHCHHWADGGETEIDNLCSLCAYHHRFVHEYAYTVSVDPDGPKFFDPKGRRVVESPPPTKGTTLGWDAILIDNRPLAISAETNVCEWDGEPPDYAEIVHELVVLDGSDAGRRASTRGSA